MFFISIYNFWGNCQNLDSHYARNCKNPSITFHFITPDCYKSLETFLIETFYLSTIYQIEGNIRYFKYKACPSKNFKIDKSWDSVFLSWFFRIWLCYKFFHVPNFFYFFMKIQKNQWFFFPNMLKFLDGEVYTLILKDTEPNFSFNWFKEFQNEKNLSLKLFGSCIIFFGMVVGLTIFKA